MGLRDKLHPSQTRVLPDGLWWLAVMLGVFLIVLVLGHGPELLLSVILPLWASTLLAASLSSRRITDCSIGTTCAPALPRPSRAAWGPAYRVESRLREDHRGGAG
jgi:hypothetical protein